MSEAKPHKINLSLLPVCVHCGLPMRTHGTQTPEGESARDFDSWNRTSQRVFVEPCECRNTRPSEWVSVEERLPESIQEEGGTATHFFRSADGQIASAYYDLYYERGYAGHFEDLPAWIEPHSGEHVFMLFDPVAWIPVSALPSPPEEVEG